jgi:hypothetical protein
LEGFSTERVTGLFEIDPSNEFFAAAWRVEVLHHSNNVQYHQDDRDHNQRMNPTAGTRKPGAHVPAEETEQPQDNQHNDDRPQHGISPSTDPMKAIESRLVAWPGGSAR